MPQLKKKVVEGHFLMLFGAFWNNVQQLTLQENRRKFKKNGSTDTCQSGCKQNDSKKLLNATFRPIKNSFCLAVVDYGILRYCVGVMPYNILNALVKLLFSS